MTLSSFISPFFQVDTSNGSTDLELDQAGDLISLRVSSAFDLESGSLSPTLDEEQSLSSSDAQSSPVVIDLSQVSAPVATTTEVVVDAAAVSILNTPSDEFFSLQWGLETINAVEGWEILANSLTSTEPIIVSVIDTGIDYR
ncbi:MAG: hypothetical protein AAGB01_09935, partial [Cyanobacteria bacterium P01_F01_bin.42]